jgi:hypothetical protein
MPDVTKNPGFDNLLSQAKENPPLLEELMAAKDFDEVAKIAGKYGISIKPIDIFRHYLTMSSSLPDEDLESMLGAENMSFMTFVCTMPEVGCQPPDPSLPPGPRPPAYTQYNVTCIPVCGTTFSAPCR